MKTLPTAVFCLLLLQGCATGPTSTNQGDTYWGPGVANPDALWLRIQRLVSKKTDVEHRELASIMGNGHYDEHELFLIARGMLLTMTWEQAAALYRLATAEHKPWLCHEVITGGQFKGMTQSQVLKLLGEPDEQGALEEEWGGVWAMTYNGYGYVSDSTGALILIFDKNDTFLRIGYPS